MKIRDQKPSLFEKTECNIWTDPHIQQQLLREHLNPASDGASRNRESILTIVDFIAGHTRPGGSLLDLGCGPGLYATLLQSRGYRVTGIDFNKASIEYAIEHSPDVEYLFGDYIKGYPAGQYDAVTMIYCDMGTHSDSDRGILLKNVHSSLAPGGVFIFDVFTDGLSRDKSEGRQWDYAPAGGFWSRDEHLLLSQTFHYPQNRAFAYQYNLLTRAGNKHFIVWDRYFTPEEITDEILAAGFSTVAIHNDIIGRNNFTSDSEMFVVAVK